MKQYETSKKIVERLYANLADHQGCAMSIGLTQALMQDCKTLLSRGLEGCYEKSGK
jgi:hypothetical protein